MKILCSLLFTFFIVFPSFSQTKVPAFFADHMVLQQQESIIVSGRDKPEIPISIKTSWGENGDAVTAQNGTWEIVLETPTASYTSHHINIQGSSTIDIKEVLIGEVWLCSGQSNMEMPMKGFDKSPVNRSEDFLKTSDNPNIRLFNAPRTASLYPGDNIDGTWEKADRESVNGFSAVGYMFGRKLFEELQIPIGIIEASWGGTRIEAWLPKSVASKYPSIELTTTLPEKENERKKPTALYNGMVHPFGQFPVKGILWYQGESNRNNPEPYQSYMSDLIKAWRTQWNRPELPFYFVQIAPYAYAEFRDSQVLDANLIREAQALTAQEVPNTGLVITSDVGKCDDIHPPEKEKIAKRLANMALVEQYGFEDVAYKSPQYRSMQIDGNTIDLFFEFGKETEKSQQFDRDRKIRDFVISGEDRKFYPAQVTINADQSIRVQSDKVVHPVAVRYGFVDCLEGSLSSKAGLPVSPFRTDSWEE